MVKRLVVTRNAYLHIDRIIEFNNLRNKSTSYSKKFIRALFRELESLKKFPFMGIKTSKEHLLLLIWNDYYIYYTITETTIEIQSIYHQKEDVNR
jgi:plasmid stabilization system protein ParE